MPGSGQCEGRTRQGEPCRANVLPGSRFCLFHDPNRAEERAAGRKQGGKTTSKQRALPAGLVELPAELPLASVADVAAFLGATINQVRRGEIDPRVGNCLGVLCGQLLKAIQGVELERDVLELEREVKRLTQHGDALAEAGREAQGDGPGPQGGRANGVSPGSSAH